jgi:hypothetical protein
MSNHWTSCDAQDRNLYYKYHTHRTNEHITKSQSKVQH